jgi:hypothetical protein
MADDAHEEGAHPIDRLNFVVRLFANGDLLTGGRGVLKVVRLMPEIDGFGVVRGAHVNGVVVVVCPQDSGRVRVTADADDGPCINGRAKIWMEVEN